MSCVKPAATVRESRPRSTADIAVSRHRGRGYGCRCATLLLPLRCSAICV